jgi:uncharacterized membrane protein YbhN (UPF0104 family)
MNARIMSMHSPLFAALRGLRPWGWLLLRVAGAAVLMYAIARYIDFSEVWRVLRTAHAPTMFLAALLTAVAWSIAIAKWRMLLPAVSLAEVTEFFLLGLLYSLVLPGQLAGEAVKTVRLAARGPGLGVVTASVVLDRLTSLLGLGIVAVAGLWLAGRDSATFGVIARSLLVFTLLITTLLFALRWPRLQRLAGRIRMLHQFTGLWADYGRNRQLVAKTLGLGVLFNIANVATVAAIAAALGVSLHVGDVAWVVGLVSVVTLLPFSFGGIGVREASFVALLGLINVPTAAALTISLICSLIVAIGAFLGLLVELRGSRSQPRRGA